MLIILINKHMPLSDMGTIPPADDKDDDYNPERDQAEHDLNEILKKEEPQTVLKVTHKKLSYNEMEQALAFEAKNQFKEQTGRKIHCRFYIPIGRSRKQVGECKVPQTTGSFKFKPSKVKSEMAEYFIRSELCDTQFKPFRKRSDNLIAEFWLNNPSQIDKSDKGRDVITDAREIANSHHRFVAKNLLEQNVMIFVVMAMIGMIGMMVAIGYAISKAPSERQIYTTANGTQYIFQDGKLIAQGLNIHPVPASATQAR